MPRIKKLLALAADESVDLWALDEVHFCQHGSRCRMWVPPEDRDPICLHHPTRKSIGYFGAVRLGDGKFASRREDGKFEGASFWEFLKSLEQVARRPGRRVVCAQHGRSPDGVQVPCARVEHEAKATWEAAAEVKVVRATGRPEED